MFLSRLSMPCPAATVGLFILLAPAVAGAQDSTTNGSAERPVTSGVYTGEQAKRGEETFLVNCVSCHSAKDYTGDAFKMSWVSRTAFDLWDQIRRLMPDDNPGILSPQEYADVVAYMFSLNGYPAGAAELPAEDASLKRVKIDAPPGAGPDASLLAALRRYQHRQLR